MTEARHYALEAFFGPGRDEMVSYTPHAHHLGMRVIEIGAAFAICTLPYREEIIGDPQRRVVFGGAITTLLDHASGIAVACALEELVPVATIDLRVDYLRAATPGLDLFARSDCYRVTRNVAFVRAIAYDSDPADPFAGCMGAFMIGANRSGAPMAQLLREAKGS
jgi:uncharacterized protein (TIGR00369 family)